MKKLLLFLALGSAALAQSFNTLHIIPVGGGASQIDFYDNAGVNYLGLVAPGTLGGNATLVLPAPTGTAGCVLIDAVGVMTAGSCSGTGSGVTSLTNGGNINFTGGPTGAITISLPQSVDTTASPRFAALGINTAPSSFTLDVNGTINAHGNISLSTDSAYNLFGPSLAPAASYFHDLNADSRTVLGALVTQNASSSPTWFITGGAGQVSGASYFQDVTSRYVFNSAGDVPQTGTIDISAGGVVTLTSGGPFDGSWAGGQLVVCPTACTTSNGALYTIANPVSTGTTLTINGWAGGSVSGYGFTYSANAYQTSTGTMQGTGAGYWHAQGYEAAGGYTANVGSFTGTITCSGSNAIWNSGVQFDESWVGNLINISSVNYTITSFQTTTQITLNAACTSGAYVFTQYGFQNSNRSFHVDSSGNVTGLVVTGTNGVVATSAGDGVLSALGSALGGHGILALEPSNATANCWYLNAGGGTSLLLTYLGSCTGSPTTEVTFGTTGVTFAQNISAPNCCNLGVTSVSAGPGISLSGSTGAVTITNSGVDTFNGRSGAVSLTATDVSTAGGIGTFNVTSASDAFLGASGSGLGGTAQLILSASGGTSCWNEDSAGGATLILRYTASCSGTTVWTNEVTYTSSGVIFAHGISVPSCSGCSSGGVTSVSGSGAGISISPTTGSVIVQNTGVTSLSNGGNITFSGGPTGSISISIPQPVATTSNVTFNGVTANSFVQSNQFQVPGWSFTPTSGSAVWNASGYEAAGNVGVSCSGAPTASFASVSGIVTHC